MDLIPHVDAHIFNQVQSQGRSIPAIIPFTAEGERFNIHLDHKIDHPTGKVVASGDTICSGPMVDNDQVKYDWIVCELPK